MSFCFGPFALDQERRQLLRLGEPVPLEAKAFELLCLLLVRRPRVLSKVQIRDVLWPGTSVGETSLPRLVTALRQALGDDAQQSRFIRTAHGFGYAFCGEARESPGEGREARTAALPAAVEATGSAPTEVSSGGATASVPKMASGAGRWRMAIVASGVAFSSAWVRSRFDAGGHPT